MKSKKRNAAQIAGVLLALGLLLMPCATAMAIQERVNEKGFPVECGDPDIPGNFTGDLPAQFSISISFESGRLLILVFPRTTVLKTR